MSKPSLAEEGAEERVVESEGRELDIKTKSLSSYGRCDVVSEFHHRIRPTCHVILKIIFSEGPRAAPEPSREILLRGPKTTLGEPLGAPFGGSLMGPLIELYF